jgi:antitoxin (DNA-binding transcriptional repressor) of toxin-antitoxin stability system
LPYEYEDAYILEVGTASIPAIPGRELTDVTTGSYHYAMRAVGIKVLKNKLSEYVRVAADGETVLVTDRDRVVAELGPPQPGRAVEVSDALLADVVRRGWLRPPIASSEALPPRKPVAPLADLLQELDADRSDR